MLINADPKYKDEGVTNVNDLTVASEPTQQRVETNEVIATQIKLLERERLQERV